MNDAMYVDTYLGQTIEIAESISRPEIVKAIEILRRVKGARGRLFILGMGGSAASASHAVNDFRKIAGIETYAPTDNVAELTARANDDGWDFTLEPWLVTSKLCERDAVLVFSVGGGSATASHNIVLALKLAVERGAKILSIVSRDGGYAREMSDACVLVPVVDDQRITPHAEGWHGVVWHMIVNAI